MKEFPLTVRRSIEILGLCAVFGLVYLGSDIVTPILLAFLVSILLMPVFGFFRRLKVPEALAIVAAIVLAVLVIFGIVSFFSYQVSVLVSDFPQLQKNLMVHWKALSNWISGTMHVSPGEQMAMIQKQSGFGAGMGRFLQTGFSSLTSMIIFFGLLPIYVFLIMFYRKLILKFVFMWFPRASHTEVTAVLTETQLITKSYLIGLMIQITYMTVLVGGLMLLFGIPHALLIGIIFAILNLIPYIGALIGNLIGVILTLASSNQLSDIFIVLIVIGAVQFLDNNILMPRIVGSKVKINAFVSIVGVILGGTLAGIAGMFLSLPVMAILKIVFDRTENFKQWGVLLGDERPEYTPLNRPENRKVMQEIREEIKEESKDDLKKGDKKD
ncbi:MAG TPA: AI-2E family transporter [Flavipsychrobacter sp.]|nr:AI-2E family transporter [Flavipsychrobacter sp.]